MDLFQFLCKLYFAILGTYLSIIITKRLKENDKILHKIDKTLRRMDERFRRKDGWKNT